MNPYLLAAIITLTAAIAALISAYLGFIFGRLFEQDHEEATARKAREHLQDIKFDQAEEDAIARIQKMTRETLAALDGNPETP